MYVLVVSFNYMGWDGFGHPWSGSQVSGCVLFSVLWK